MLVKDVMTEGVITLSPDDFILDAVRLFKKKRISGIPVVENGRIVGMITESDIMEFMEVHEFGSELMLPAPFDFIEAAIDLRAEIKEIEHEFNKLRKGTVGSIMRKNVHTIRPDAHVSEAADIMTEHKVNRLPVMDGKGKMVGIVARYDLLKSLL